MFILLELFYFRHNMIAECTGSVEQVLDKYFKESIIMT